MAGRSASPARNQAVKPASGNSSNPSTASGPPKRPGALKKAWKKAS